MDEATSEDLAFPTLFGGGTALLSPFQRSPHSAYGSLPPFLGQVHNSFPATKGAYPLGTPKHRFSATMFTFEGIRRRRARGLSEHDIIHRTALRIIERLPGERNDKHAEFRRAEKVEEGMA